MKKGFTLMEMLAVVLILAVIFSFGVPAWRAVRFDIKNAQAHEAAQKLADAMRAFYLDNRGQKITPTCFSGTDTHIFLQDSCYGAGVIGKPVSGTLDRVDVGVLFGCRYLRMEEFHELPYTFCIAPNYTNVGKDKMPDLAQLINKGIYLTPDYSDNTWESVAYFMVTACGSDEKTAGKKYVCGNDKKGYIYVDGHMKVADTYE